MKKLQDTEYTGTLPATLQTVAGYLVGYKIYGNTGGVGNEAIVASLSEPLCGIYTNSDSLDLSAGTLTRKIRKFELTGEENITLYTVATGNLFRIELPTLRVLGQFAGAGMCTHYRTVAKAVDRVNGTISGGSSAGVQIFVDIVDDYATADDFKFYLAAQYATGTPVTIWYVLAEPEISTVPVPSGFTGTIEGYLIQDGTPTPEAPIYPSANGIRNADDTYSIQYGYKLPITSNSITTDIYIGDTQLAKDEYVDSETGQIYRYVDGALTPTEPPTPLPQIPTFAGETTIDYGATALPHAAGLDGIFEYGNIDGLTWKNSVSGENDITFDAAVTDTGAEYVLPTGATGQYTSKSGEYRTAFTWYCIAKCPTTCHSAGQYMISNWNNQGVEISSGWAAYSSAGVNHLVRSINNNDFNSAEAVTSYALIVVSGDVNGVASIYVNGEKKTDSWNFSPVPSDRAAAIFLGKRASGQLSGTDIDYKFLAFGTTKQTDAEITANSQYLMTKYLGVGRPEKVELDVHDWANTLYSIYHQGKWINGVEKKRVNGKWIADFETIIYGFHVDPSVDDPANAVTYLLDAVGKTPATNSSSVVDYSDWADAFFMPKPCMLNYDGTVAYYLNPNDYTKKADGSPSDVANPLFPGNAMMEWSVIWWKYEAGEVEGEMSFYVSNRQVDSTYHCWCNIDAENHITDHFYTSIYNGTSATTYSDSATYAVDDLVTYSSAEYKCTTAVETPEAFDSTRWEKVSDVTRLRSLSGKALTAANGNGNTTGTVEVQRATANNTTATVEWYTDVFSDRQLINGLLTLVSKTLDSSAVYGRGLDLSGRATKEAYITGTLDDKGLFWGNPSAGTSAKKCFGMENWDGCVWHRTAGLIGSSSTGGYAYKLTYNTADGSTATSYNSTGSGYLVGATGDGITIARPSDGYVTTMKVASATGIWLPGTVGGSTSTYYCDYYYGGSRYGLAGGRSSYGAHCGCWFLNLGTAFGTADWGVAASPSCKPLASKWKVFEGGDS